MSEETAGGAVAEGAAEISAAKERVYCKVCGSERVHRVYREGYFEERILPLFGFFPWRCSACGERLMLHKRHRDKRHDHSK